MAMSKPMQSIVSVEAVTAEWLTEALAAAGRLDHGRVVSVSFEPCGIGQLADSFRFTMTYEPSGAGPATLVGKFASEDATSREFGRSSGYYRCEIGFYQKLAPTLSMSIPTAVHAALDDNDTDFVLLMEDLAPARQVDQLIGCNADESARVMEQAATLHAASWHDRDLAQQLYGDLVPEANLKEAARLVDHTAAWKQIFSDPQCLWHSDLRADNVLFDASDNTRPVVVLDWQGVGFGRGTIDVAYWLGTSMAVDDRRKHERELITHYHRALVGNGVSDYPWERCWDDYRIHAIHGLQVGVFGLGAVKRSPRGDTMWKSWIERTAEQVRDLDSFSALAKR